MLQITLGQRVHHKCEFPDCPIYGKVLTVDQSAVMRTGDGRQYTGWAFVEWEPYQGTQSSIPLGYRQWVPLERLD